MFRRAMRVGAAGVGVGAALKGGAASADYPPWGLSDNVKALPEWIQLGCGEDPYYCTEKGSTFGCDHRCPDKMPDFSKHSNFMAEFLRDHPDVYHKYKNLKTKL